LKIIQDANKKDDNEHTYTSGLFEIKQFGEEDNPLELGS